MIKNLKILDIIMVLLGHSVKDVVFYASGCLVNLFNDEELRFSYSYVESNIVKWLLTSVSKL